MRERGQRTALEMLGLEKISMNKQTADRIAETLSRLAKRTPDGVHLSGAQLPANHRTQLRLTDGLVAPTEHQLRDMLSEHLHQAPNALLQTPVRNQADRLANWRSLIEGGFSPANAGQGERESIRRYTARPSGAAIDKTLLSGSRGGRRTELPGLGGVTPGNYKQQPGFDPKRVFKGYEKGLKGSPEYPVKLPHQPYPPEAMQPAWVSPIPSVARSYTTNSFGVEPKGTVLRSYRTENMSRPVRNHPHLGVDTRYMTDAQVQSLPTNTHYTKTLQMNGVPDYEAVVDLRDVGKYSRPETEFRKLHEGWYQTRGPNIFK